jgi:hypothetical protein
MRNRTGLAAGLLTATIMAAPFAWADSFPLKTPMQVGPLHPPVNAGYHHPDITGFRTGAQHDLIQQGLRAGTLTTLPGWTSGFTVNGQNYSYTLLGTDPALGAATTVIPTIIVPIRLTIPDYLVNGQPLVLDGSRTTPNVLNSPIFHDSNYDSGHGLQFTDAMLHAEFTQAPKDWHLKFSPSVAPVIDVTTTPGKTDVYIAKSGKYAAVINDGVVDKAILKTLRQNFTPTAYVVFVTYNALEGGAFGYHSGLLSKDGTALQIFTYTSWLEGVGDVFGLPSPNSDTLAHEAAEVVHDAFGTSLTLKWGDWFDNNRCFQPYIEVGDAVEDAPAKVQNTPQIVTVNGTPKTYTVQSEALLPFFTRQYPSPAIHGAYSWPNETAILGPAPLKCAK